MLTINHISNHYQLLKSKKQNQITRNKNISFESSNNSTYFKNKLIKNNSNKTFFKKIIELFGLTSIIATNVNSNSSLKKETIDWEKDLVEEWNSDCKGYKVLLEAGFSDELINASLNKIKPKEANLLKNGLNIVRIKDAEETINGIYNGFNNDLKNNEESAIQTLKILIQIFEQKKEGRIFLHYIKDAVSMYGIKVFEKGKLNDGGFFEDSFAFVNSKGENIANHHNPI